MTMKWLALPIMAIAACAVGSSSSKAYAAAPQAPQYVQDRGDWEMPPSEFRDVQRRGFHDGVQGARRDFDHHRPANVNGREEYRHPHVDPSVRDDYRDGFRRGYEVAMHHLMDYPDR